MAGFRSLVLVEYRAPRGDGKMAAGVAIVWPSPEGARRLLQPPTAKTALAPMPPSCRSPLV